MYMVSVVISTWRRPLILEKVLLALSKQTISHADFEVLVIDSNSGDSTPDVIDTIAKQSDLVVRLINCNKNIISAKRNLGIDNATGRYIVFLDDDCIPNIDHLEKFLRSTQGHEGNKIAWCGGVRFKEEWVKKSNYYKYRNECHFSEKFPKSGNLKFNQIVTMNMLIDLKVLKNEGIRFDERFMGYGCEDIEFGWRLTAAGFIIKSSAAEIEHEEIDGSITKFKLKLIRASRDGFAVLNNVNPLISTELGFTSMLELRPKSAIEFNYLKILFLTTILDSSLPLLVEKLVVAADKFRLLYSRSAYRLVLAAAHRKGYLQRANNSMVTLQEANKDGWYS